MPHAASHRLGLSSQQCSCKARREGYPRVLVCTKHTKSGKKKLKLTMTQWSGDVVLVSESSLYRKIPINARYINIQIHCTLSHCQSQHHSFSFSASDIQSPLSQHHSFSFSASNIQSPLSQHHSFSFSASLSITTSLTTSLPRPHCLSPTVSLFLSQPHSLNIQPHDPTSAGIPV